MTNRHSVITGTTIEYSGHLIVDGKGGMKLSRSQPGLAPGERAIKLTVKVPRAIFKTPALVASIEVPQDTSPPVINAETLGQIENALSMGVGLKVSVTVGE